MTQDSAGPPDDDPLQVLRTAFPAEAAAAMELAAQQAAALAALPLAPSDTP